MQEKKLRYLINFTLTYHRRFLPLLDVIFIPHFKRFYFVLPTFFLHL